MARVYNLKADFHRLRETLLLPILLAIIDALIYMRLISITKRRILNRKIRWREIRFAPRFLVEESTITFVYLHTSGRCPGESGLISRVEAIGLNSGSLESRASSTPQLASLSYLHSASVALPITLHLVCLQFR